MEHHESQAAFSADERMADLLEQFKALQAKMAYMESHAPGHHTRHDSITGRTEMTDDGLDSDQGPIRQLTNSNTIFEARDCNLTQFKNRFTEDDGRYAIDVLVSGPLLGQEIREEIKLREQRAGYGSHWEQYQQPQKQQSSGARKSARKAKANVLKTATNISTSNSDAIRAVQSSDTWIRRIRLQSPALLKIMASVQGETWAFRPRTYFRPFSSLIYFQPQMKKRLAELEERWGHFIHADGSVIPFSAPNTSYDASSPFHEGYRESQQEPVDNGPLALLAMRDEFSILWWDSHDRNRLLGETSEVVPIRTGVGMWAQNHSVSEGDSFLVQLADNDNRGLQTGREFLRKEGIALISPRVYAYVFQEGKFAQLDVRYFVDSVGANKEALNFLRIPLNQEFDPAERQGAFDTRRNEKDGGIPVADFPRLHPREGLRFPGVGKTATAEAVAQTLGKPLFKITCGDLGLTPEQVEASLRAIFRLASLWDTILLLDEVDTFFSQRSKGDGAITKNALVSVFLRILDYYPGILFMTTNRAGALDEAFKSRIHYQIYYPHLNRKQTLEIWEINLDRLRKTEEDDQRLWNARHDSQGDIIEDHDSEHSHGNPPSAAGAPRKPIHIPKKQILDWAAKQFRNKKPLNGRQIRNAVQVAKAPAYADAEVEVELAIDVLARHGGDAEAAAIILPAPRLDVKHFETIQHLTDEFDKYIKQVYSGMDDSRLAAEKEERADDYLPRPLSGMGWTRDQGQNSRTVHEDNTGFDGGSLSPSRSHSPVRAVSNAQVHGGSGGNWPSRRQLAVPFPGSGNPRQQQILLQPQQQQRQFQDSQTSKLSPPSPSMHHGNFRVDQQYTENHFGQDIGGESSDNGPLPGQTHRHTHETGFMGGAISDNGPLPGQSQQRQAPINIPRRNQLHGHHTGSVESQGRESDLNYIYESGQVGQGYSPATNNRGGNQHTRPDFNITVSNENGGGNVGGASGRSNFPQGMGSTHGTGNFPGLVMAESRVID